jgi:hypothetical protein
VTQRQQDHGSIGEEAARLAEAVQAWLHGRSGEHTESHDEAAPECTVCPACRLLRLVRSARPEVYEHLADAAASLSAAIRELAADGEQAAPRRGGVEHIDLG